MRNTVLPRLLAVTLLVILFAAVPAWAASEEDVLERTVALAAGGRIDISNTNGSIVVDTWDRAEVRILATKKVRADSSAEARELLDGIEVDIDSSAGAVTIRTELPSSWFGSRGSAHVGYELTVPSSARLDATSTNGAIEATGLGGNAEIRTTNGRIRVRGMDGNLRVESTNGGIDVRNLRGALDAHTTNGGIDAEIDAVQLDSDVRLVTTNGTVELTLSAGLAARIEARTSNGSIRTDFDAVVRRPRYGPRRSLDFDLNGGGRLIEIRTSNGSIRVNRM